MRELPSNPQPWKVPERGSPSGGAGRRAGVTNLPRVPVQPLLFPRARIPGSSHRITMREGEYRGSEGFGRRRSTPDHAPTSWAMHGDEYRCIAPDREFHALQARDAYRPLKRGFDFPGGAPSRTRTGAPSRETRSSLASEGAAGRVRGWITPHDGHEHGHYTSSAARSPLNRSSLFCRISAASG